MKTFDLVIALISAFLVVKTLVATSLNRQVEVKGSVSGLFIGNLIICFAVCFLIVIRAEQFQYPWLPPIFMAIYLAVSFLVKSGLASGGLCYNGRRIAFSEMEFYAIEAITQKNFRLRVHGFNKEYILAFPLDKREEVEKRLKKANVKFAQRVSPGERKGEEK